MPVKIENPHLSVKIKNKGAELYSVINKENQLEYMWGADPAFWGKTSPVLFPIVGTLRNDTYIYKEKTYNITRHGFARDSTFEVISQAKDQVTFSLKSNSDSLKNYPFEFELRIRYALKKNNLKVSYEVINEGKENMYFSIGAHPAFKIPLIENSHYNNYYLEFNVMEDIDMWPINAEGLIAKKSLPLLVDSNRLNLSKELFYNNALVLKNYKTNKISLKSSTHPYGLDFQFKGFPYFGIWAAKDADFLCLEPWCGIADSVDHDQHIERKEGIHVLSSGKDWSRSWGVTFY